MIFDSCLTDMHTCLKLVPTADFRQLTLIENGFGMDTELTARLLRGGVRPVEIPIRYTARSVEDGKKITWRDGLRCISVLIRVRMQRAQRLSSRPTPPQVASVTPMPLDRTPGLAGCADAAVAV
jgi:hypothetical protein